MKRYWAYLATLLILGTFVTAQENVSFSPPDWATYGPAGPSNNNPIDVNKELIQKWCFSVQSNLIWLIFISMFMWIIEPAIIKKLDYIEPNELHPLLRPFISVGTIPFLFKWVGLGLMFMVAYSLWSLM